MKPQMNADERKMDADKVLRASARHGCICVHPF
jgi:hypothetical protein